MTRAEYKEWWKREDDITAEWCGQTSRWLGGMQSSDGSVIVTHNENGINLQVGPSAANVIPQSEVQTSATPEELAPYTYAVNDGAYLHLRRPRVALVDGTNRIIQSSATADAANPATLFTVDETPSVSGIYARRGGVSIGGLGNTAYMSEPRYRMDLLSDGNANPRIRCVSATITTYEAYFSLDSTPVDIGLQLRIDGGYLQTRTRQLLLDLRDTGASGSAPQIYMTAATYSDWVNQLTTSATCVESE